MNISANKKVKERIAIFASGRGSNAESIIKYLKESNGSLDLICLITDNPNARALGMAQSYGITTALIPFPEGEGSKQKLKEQHEREILEYLKKQEITMVLLAGYMRILGPKIINAFYDSKLKVSKIINIHPSLLPKYPGLDGYKRAYDSQDEKVGCTIHFVDSGVDTGPIILQSAFDKHPTEDFDQFVNRGLANEHMLFRHFLELWEQGIACQGHFVSNVGM